MGMEQCQKRLRALLVPQHCMPSCVSARRASGVDGRRRLLSRIRDHGAWQERKAWHAWVEKATTATAPDEHETQDEICGNKLRPWGGQPANQKCTTVSSASGRPVTARHQGLGPGPAKSRLVGPNHPAAIPGILSPVSLFFDTPTVSSSTARYCPSAIPPIRCSPAAPVFLHLFSHGLLADGQCNRMEWQTAGFSRFEPNISTGMDAFGNSGITIFLHLCTMLILYQN